MLDAKADVTGNLADDIRGKGKQVEGKIQQEWGKSKDMVRRELDKS